MNRRAHSLVSCILLIAALAALPARAIAAQPALSEKEKAQVIDGAFARIREVYIAPEDIGTFEAAIRAKAARGGYRSATTGEELASQLGADLAQFSGDPHFRVLYFEAGVPPLPSGMQPPPESDSDRKARYDRAAALNNNGFARAERLEGNVGYVELVSVPSPSMMAGTCAAAMTFVAHTSALIIDLRRNRGGDPDGVGHVLSYFLNERVHIYDWLARKPEDNRQYFTEASVPGPRYAAGKPVFVLTSQNTFSGGEALADGMQTFVHARLVGERTRGGANAALPVKVNDHFVVGVPFMRTINKATGKTWNGTGLTPDVPVAAAQAQDVAYRLALEAIVATAKNPAQREQTQALLNTLSQAAPSAK